MSDLKLEGQDRCRPSDRFWVLYGGIAMASFELAALALSWWSGNDVLSWIVSGFAVFAYVQLAPLLKADCDRLDRNIALLEREIRRMDMQNRDE